MANMSHLIVLEHESAVSNTEQTRVVRSAKNCIPPLWLSCFRAGDFRDVAVQVTVNEGSAVEYFRMPVVGTSLALERCEKFTAALAKNDRCRAAMNSALRTLSDSIKSSDASFLQLYDFEIQCMIGQESHEQWLGIVLPFIDMVSVGALDCNRALASQEALELFDQVGVDPEAWEDTFGWTISLAGFDA